LITGLINNVTTIQISKNNAAVDTLGDESHSQPRLRIAVAVQRYGLDVNGGAEALARLIVEQLRTRHSITVLTTQARDYTTWQAHYPAGSVEIDGTPVIRFQTSERGHSGRAKVMPRHVLRYRFRHLLTRLGIVRVALPSPESAAFGIQYFERTGPYCPDLVSHLRESADRYDLVIFVTALYYQTAVGLLNCPVPTILVPTLHDERSMYWPLFHEVFRRAKWVLWMTEAERQLATRLYGNNLTQGSVCGVGIDVPQISPEVRAATLTRFGITGPYLVFVGRVSRAKGFDVLAAAFKRLRSVDGQQVQLIVIGQDFMEMLPQHRGIVYTGFVDDSDRDALIAGAAVSVVCSKHESLSMVTLESMALGTPVIVNGRSDVLRGHIEASGAGLVYGRQVPLVTALRKMLALPPERRAEMGAAGQRYVRENYNWDRVRSTLFDAVDKAVAAE
jgi:glycosyltransferase involved in cell wall biosynthesis